MLEIITILPILLFSIVIHEIAHGWAAWRLGDSTARDLGRLTLNPIPHIDPIGSVIVPLISVLSAGTVFIAWAKPVPVNPLNFSKMRRDDILVSVAGPASNLVVALGCVIAYVVVSWTWGWWGRVEEGIVTTFLSFLVNMFAAGVSLNVFLAVFNMMPVPPLDGSHVVASLLPESAGEQFRRIGFFGILLILLLMRVDAFRTLMFTVVAAIQSPYFWLMGAMT